MANSTARGSFPCDGAAPRRRRPRRAAPPLLARSSGADSEREPLTAREWQQQLAGRYRASLEAAGDVAGHRRDYWGAFVRSVDFSAGCSEDRAMSYIAAVIASEGHFLVEAGRIGGPCAGGGMVIGGLWSYYNEPKEQRTSEAARPGVLGGAAVGVIVAIGLGIAQLPPG